MIKKNAKIKFQTTVLPKCVENGRIIEEIEQIDKLSKNKYGFRKRRSKNAIWAGDHTRLILCRKGT